LTAKKLRKRQLGGLCVLGIWVSNIATAYTGNTAHDPHDSHSGNSLEEKGTILTAQDSNMRQSISETGKSSDLALGDMRLSDIKGREYPYNNFFFFCPDLLYIILSPKSCRLG